MFRLPRGLQGRGFRSRAHRNLSLALVVMFLVSIFSAVLEFGSVPAAFAAPAKQAPLPTNISTSMAHPGSALVALRTPAQVAGHHFAGSNASATDLAAVNKILDGLGTTSIKHLFTNIPADALNAARQRAMADTGTYITDFTQVYEVSFNASINPGEAVNRLSPASLISSAMPNWVYQKPAHEKFKPTPQAQKNSLFANNRGASKVTASDLPLNYSYITDGQSYHDAASNNVTGAFAMLKEKFGKTPGAGEYVTNISLGTIDDTSTIVEHGQRYLEQTGFPKIPVWLSNQNCTTLPDGSQSCSITLDPNATNTDDGQGDLGEVLLDFSVMAPPPRGDARVPNPQAPDQLGEILGTAYGASFRLINPLVNGTPDFFAAFLGAGFLQTPKPDVITASIVDGFGLGFSDYFFEQETMIHDVVTLLVSGQDIFVTISAGDGQTNTNAAMNPNGITGPTEVTKDASKIVDINDPNAWANPKYSYGITFEPQYLIDSGANSSGGDALNDIFNNAPWNKSIDSLVSHTQHTTETRWTGQQNFHSGSGSRTNVAAPADDVLYLAQVIDPNTGLPVTPIAVEPELIGGTSASSPEIAGAAAVLRQTAKLLGHPLTAKQTRQLMVDTGRDNLTPAFDLNDANVGKVLDLSMAMAKLFKNAGVENTSYFVRMTVAERKAIPYSNGYGRGFFSDTAQDPVAKTATINLSQGLAADSNFDFEDVAATGDNLNSPITFGVDVAWPRDWALLSWKLAIGSKSVDVPAQYFDSHQPYLRLLPAEIFGLLGEPVTSTKDRTVRVSARNYSGGITTSVTFKGQADATYTHAVPPSFRSVFHVWDNSSKITLHYDLRGLRDANGGLADGGVLIVSDIDRALPRAFTDRDPDSHGFKIKLTSLTGTVTITPDQLPNGVGTYGIAIRGTKGGTEILDLANGIDSTSSWLPLRFAPQMQQIPQTPKVLTPFGFGGTVPRFYDIIDKEPGGSSLFQVSYDVRAVSGAKSTLIEFSAPTANFFKGLFIGGPIGIINNFTNPNGDRLDKGNRLGQPGSVYSTKVTNTHGTVTLDATAGLSIPMGKCDNTYQVRVFGLDASGKVVGVASNPSVISYTDLSSTACS